jgi:hypothetical protein
VTPGIIHGLSMDDYLADPAPVCSLSSGVALTLDQESPLHAWCCTKLNPRRVRDASKEADIGSCAHDVLLEGGTDRIAVIDPEDYPSQPKKKGEAGSIPKGWTNSAIREARDIARAAGKYPILKEAAAAVHDMVGAARDFIERSELRGIFDRSQVELTLLWQEGPTWLRARPDLLSDDRDVMLHVKTTTGSAGPRAFERVIDSQGYDFVLMFYARGLLALEGQKAARTRHIILAQEQSAPYSCALYDLTPAKAAIADARVARAIDTWARCMATNRWPSYTTRIHSIEPKPWQIAEDQEREYLGLTLDPVQEREGVQV